MSLYSEPTSLESISVGFYNCDIHTTTPTIFPTALGQYFVLEIRGNGSTRIAKAYRYDGSVVFINVLFPGNAYYRGWQQIK